MRLLLTVAAVAGAVAAVPATATVAVAEAVAAVPATAWVAVASALSLRHDKYQGKECPPLDRGSFNIDQYQLYPENADWDEDSCLVYFG